ncbi:MAG: citrate/H+ symporter, CitMHS family [Bacillota bacterium]|jgi:CitMHS family citrate-Mg2+:H+ or citrate-Ca2+:H+ symporter|nr:citrate/H+ symporter, CitMHS family [Bacillota bacterium]
MLAYLGYLMIIVFMVLLLKKKISPFVGLIMVPMFFGIIVCFIQDISILEAFTWLKEGIFYKVVEGKVIKGTMGTATLLLFAILFFSIMLDVGLFDPMCTKLIKMTKGDPLRICIVTAIISAIVSLDGDGTTTVLIVTAAVLSLFKKMKMNQIYLALLIAIPNSIMNYVPWSGPMARAMPVLNIGPKEFFLPIIPGMAVSLVFAMFMAWKLGMNERKRLNYHSNGNSNIDENDINEIIFELQEKNKELKRPKLFWFNFILTIAVMAILIIGLIDGGVIFLVATAFALLVNYKDPGLQAKRLVANGEEALGPVGLVFGAGAIMGILNGSGMSEAIAQNIVSFIPSTMGTYVPLLLALVSLPALIFLPNDAFYFGILPVIAPIAYSFGATPVEVGVASLIGQATRFCSPLVAFLYVLVDRTGVDFGDYQRAFFKWALPIYFIQLFTAILIGAIPV